MKYPKNLKEYFFGVTREDRNYLIRNYIFIFVFFLFGILSMQSAYAVSCSPNPLHNSWINGENPSNVNLVCTNENNNTFITLSKSGECDYINFSNIMGYDLSHTFEISFSPNTPIGRYTCLLNPSDLTSSVLINYNVSEINNIPSNYPLVFPTSKVINVQQGQSKSINIQLIVPSSYPRPITVQSISLDPDIDVCKLGDLDLGILNPGQTLNIPIVISATNAQVGTYNTKLTILATDSNGALNLPSSNLQIVVSIGVNPITNETFSTPPICSLSSNSMLVNNTYAFTCTNVPSNIQVSPRVNNFFTGMSANFVSGMYTYNFKVNKNGNTNFTADFFYMNSPIFNPFSQPISISGSNIAYGNTLGFVFTPSLDVAQPNQNIIINIINNQSKSIVSNAYLTINAVPLVSLDGYTFNTTFEPDKVYTLRGKAEGYDDIIIDAKLLSKIINISISPSFGDTTTFFSIKPSDLNASLWINGNKVTNNSFYGNLPFGNNSISVGGNGFYNVNYSLFVSELTTSAHLSDFKKGVVNTILLSKSMSWQVMYQKDINSAQSLLLSGNSSSIDLNPSKTGIYTIIETNGRVIDSYTLKGFEWKGLLKKWWFWLGIVIVIFLIFRLSKSRNEVNLPYAGAINTG